MTRREALTIALVVAAPLTASALVDAMADRVRREVLAHLADAARGDAAVHRRRVATTYGWGCGHPFPPFVDARTPHEAVFDEQLLAIDPDSPSMPPPPDRFAMFELEGRFTGVVVVPGQGCPRTVPQFRVESWCYTGVPAGVEGPSTPDPSWPRCRAQR